MEPLITALGSALRDKDWQVAESVVRALGTLADPRAAEVLATALTAGDSDVSGPPGRLLGGWGWRSAVLQPPLRQRRRLARSKRKQSPQRRTRRRPRPVRSCSRTRVGRGFPTSGTRPGTVPTAERPLSGRSGGPHGPGGYLRVGLHRIRGLLGRMVGPVDHHRGVVRCESCGSYDCPDPLFQSGAGICADGHPSVLGGRRLSTSAWTPLRAVCFRGRQGRTLSKRCRGDGVRRVGRRSGLGGLRADVHRLRQRAARDFTFPHRVLIRGAPVSLRSPSPSM